MEVEFVTKYKCIFCKQVVYADMGVCVDNYNDVWLDSFTDVWLDIYNGVWLHSYNGVWLDKMCDWTSFIAVQSHTIIVVLDASLTSSL